METRSEQELVAAEVAYILSLPVGEFRDPSSFSAILVELLRQDALLLTGHKSRDIDTITQIRDDTSYRWEIHGTRKGTIRRLLLEIVAANGDVELAWVVTQRNLHADMALVGQRGRDRRVGNRILFIRLLNLTVRSGTLAGVSELRGKPADDRLRSFYSAIGFVDGARLDLCDPDAIERVVAFITRQYVRLQAKYAKLRWTWPA